MIIASIPLWLLAAFLFWMGCASLAQIKDAESNKVTVLFCLFVVCLGASSMFAFAASWVAS